MNFPNLKAICIVKFSDGTENSVFMYVPRPWILNCNGKNVTVVLPEEDKAELLTDPTFINKLPSASWQQYEGTIVYETDNLEEAIQIVNLNNKNAKRDEDLMENCTAIVTSLIQNFIAEFSMVNQHGPFTSLGEKKLNTVTILEIIQPIVAELNQYIGKVIDVNRGNQVINEQLENIKVADSENVVRLTTFSINYTEFFRKSMHHHINCLTRKIMSPFVTVDDVMLENLKIMSELMSTFIVTMCVANGNIK